MLLTGGTAPRDGAGVLAKEIALASGLPGRVEGITVPGLAGPEVVSVARTLHPDLLVIGSHAGRSVHRMALGSTSAYVARLAPCPVLVVRRQALPRRILVAHDGSPDARAVLHTLRALGPLPGTEVHLVRVVPEGPPTETLPRHARRFAPGIGRVARNLLREAEATLEADARAYRQAGFVETRIAVLAGDPWRRLRGEVRRFRPDLVAVGATGRRSIRMMPASIPDRLLREAPASILVSRAQRALGVELQ